MELPSLGGTWLIEDQRYQRRGVPEPHQPSTRSSSNVESERPSASRGRGVAQKVLGRRAVAGRIRPLRMRASRRLSSETPPATGANRAITRPRSVTSTSSP
jgi:hypothetical protein